MNKLIIIFALVLILSFGCPQGDTAQKPSVPSAAVGEPEALTQSGTYTGLPNEPGEISNTYVDIANVFIGNEYDAPTVERCSGSYQYSCPEGVECDYLTDYSPYKYPYYSWRIENATDAEFERYHHKNCSDKSISYTYRMPAGFWTNSSLLCHFRDEFAEICPEGKGLSLAQMYGGLAEMFDHPPSHLPAWCVDGHDDVCVSSRSNCHFNYGLYKDGVFSGPRAGVIMWTVVKGFPNLPLEESAYVPINVSGKTFYFNWTSAYREHYYVFLDCKDKVVYYDFNGADIARMDELNQQYMEELAEICS